MTEVGGLHHCVSRLGARAVAAPGSLIFQLRRRLVARRYLHGVGLEIGALHAPLHVPRGVTVRYVDRLDLDGLRKHYPDLPVNKLVHVDVVDDGEGLTSQPDASADFVIANHFIEHTEDPLGTLSNHLRVLRPGGILYLAVPNRHHTFDADREPTSLQHIIRDHRDGPSWSRRGHQEEWALLVDKVTLSEVAARVQVLQDDNYSIHFHVWDRDEFLAMLHYAREILNLPFRVVTVPNNSHEFIVVLRRVDGVPPMSNESPG